MEKTLEFFHVEPFSIDFFHSWSKIMARSITTAVSVVGFE